MPKLVVGLGNPGRKYDRTRHNVGFMVLDAFAERAATKVSTLKCQGFIGEVRLQGEKTILLKPLTFMNLSGKSVVAAARFFKVAPADLLIVHDDLDLPAGHLRLRPGGGAGGHNGVKSVIAELGTPDFPRLRIGIGRPLPEWEVVDWVLTPFSDAEQPLVKEAVDRAASAVALFATDGIEAAMNRFNRVHQE